MQIEDGGWLVDRGDTSRARENACVSARINACVGASTAHRDLRAKNDDRRMRKRGSENAKNLVRDSVAFVVPDFKGLLALTCKQAREFELAHGWIFAKFIINKTIVKTRLGSFLPTGRIVDFAGSSPIQST